MTRTISKPKAFLWCPGPHLESIARAVDGAGWSVVGVGVPPRSPVEEMPRTLVEVPRYDDPRVGVTDAGADVGLFVDAAPLDDEGLVKLCAQQELTLIALGPAPEGVHAWTASGAHESGPRVAPLLADSVLHADAREAMAPIGAVVGVSVRMSAPAALGGVASRLYDAMHLLHRHMGVPEQVDASCAGAKTGGEVSLRELRGAVHAHLRYPGAGATLAIADTVGVLSRDALLECQAGALRLTDEGFVVVNASGAVSDRGEGRGVDPLVEQLRRATDPRLPGPEPYDKAAVLAMCEAAVLSVRTRQPERPHELLEMMR